MYVLNGNGKKILDSLTRMGLGVYEARAYFTLLLCGEMKAGVIARMSGVPQSKVYLTLENLADKDIVKVNDRRPKTYQTVPLEVVVDSYITKTQEELQDAKKSRKWLRQVVKTFSPMLRNDKGNARVFEPRYTRG